MEFSSLVLATFKNSVFNVSSAGELSDHAACSHATASRISCSTGGLFGRMKKRSEAVHLKLLLDS